MFRFPESCWLGDWTRWGDDQGAAGALWGKGATGAGECCRSHQHGKICECHWGGGEHCQGQADDQRLGLSNGTTRILRSRPPWRNKRCTHGDGRNPRAGSWKLIGRRAENLKQLQAASATRIFVDTSPHTTGPTRTVSISGPTPDSVTYAQQLIEERVNAHMSMLEGALGLDPNQPGFVYQSPADLLL